MHFFLSFTILLWGGKIVRTIILVFIVVLINIIVCCLFNEYFSLIKIGTIQIPIFILGMLAGYYSLNKKEFLIDKWVVMLFLVLLIISALLLTKNNNILGGYLSLIEKCFWIPLLSTFFVLIVKRRIGNKVLFMLRYLGIYSLEIYVLHMLFYSVLTNPYWVFGLSNKIAISTSIILSLLLCEHVNKMMNKLTKLCK